MKEFPRSLAGFIERRSLWIILLMIIITAILAPGLVYLKQEAGLDTLISPSKKAFRDTEFYNERFGNETNVILLECHESDGGFKRIFSTETLTLLDELEQYLSETHGDQIHSIVGPVTILKMAEEEARKAGAQYLWNDQEFVDMVLY